MYFAGFMNCIWTSPFLLPVLSTFGSIWRSFQHPLITDWWVFPTALVCEAHRLHLRQTFFEELLKEKTIVIPGIFFDINPSHRRNLFHSPCHHFVRLSFGPPIEDLDKGVP